MRKISLIVLIILLSLSCKKDQETNLNNSYSVEGYIFSQGNPVSEVDIMIDSSINLKTISDDVGYFKIEGVSQGKHELNMKMESDGAFITKSSSIDVSDDVILNNLILPKTVFLLSPIEQPDNSIKLIWNASDAEDFREYKIYRLNSSGLDETTGELIHVATNINDTIFYDQNEIFDSTMFYRIFVMNEFAKLGGSNIESITISNPRLKDYYNINGYVNYNNLPVDSAEVVLDNYKTSTNESGYFEFNNIYKGNYSIKVLKKFHAILDTAIINPVEPFSQNSIDIQLEMDREDINITLPKVPNLINTEKISDSEIKITWESTDAIDFKYYYLYRSPTSVIDYTTSEKVYSGSDINTTEFIDIYSSPGKYLYRLYVSDDTEMIASSQVKSVIIPETILVININYTGSYDIANESQYYYGFFDHPAWPDFQDESIIHGRGSRVELKFDQGFTTYIASFIDITNAHQGSSVLPAGSPAVIYEGIDPFNGTNSSPTEVVVETGTTTEITITYGDEFLAP